LTPESPTLNDRCPPILVAAYGNELAADDAFGPLVAEALRTIASDGVEVVDLGMKPASLLDHLSGRRAVCVVDAARCEDVPAGTLIEAEFADVSLLPCSGRDCPPCSAADTAGKPARYTLVHDAAMSSHGLAIADELGLARKLGICPREVRLVAAVALSVEIGRPISAMVRQQVPLAASRIAEWAANNLRNP
jgi:Ni,Fe-hydrogenase maturation factor